MGLDDDVATTRSTKSSLDVGGRSMTSARATVERRVGRRFWITHLPPLAEARHCARSKEDAACDDVRGSAMDARMDRDRAARRRLEGR